MVVILTLCLVFALTGCSAKPGLKTTTGGTHSSVASGITNPIDQGYTNSLEYADYSFWNRPSCLRLITDFKLEVIQGSEITPSGDSFLTLSDSDMQIVEYLREGIIAFFKKNYRLDVSKRLYNQEIRIQPFEQTSTEMFTLGFDDSTNSSLIWLNQALFTDEFNFLFKQIYIHETMHQLGINRDMDGMLQEGISDALTDQILTSMGLVFYETDAYFESRTLCYQLLAVDREIVKLYFTDKSFSLKTRIADRLSSIECKIEECDDVGQKLTDILQLFYSWHDGGIDQDYDMFPYAYDAQEIVFSYCKSFNPNNRVITYIRNHYLVDDFETFKPDVYIEMMFDN